MAAENATCDDPTLVSYFTVSKQLRRSQCGWLIKRQTVCSTYARTFGKFDAKPPVNECTSRKMPNFTVHLASSESGTLHMDKLTLLNVKVNMKC